LKQYAFLLYGYFLLSEHPICFYTALNKQNNETMFHLYTCYKLTGKHQ